MLNDTYSEVILLADSSLFFLPFEVFFMEVFLSGDMVESDRPRIYAFSSAGLSLEFLFDAPNDIGFGSALVEKLFYEEHAWSRIKHEADLLSALQELRRSRSVPSKLYI